MRPLPQPRLAYRLLPMRPSRSRLAWPGLFPAGLPRWGGGVLGRPLQAIERDDEAKNERGVQIAQELINKEKVSAAVGYINTGVALAAQRFFQDARIPVMNNVATGSVITHQFDDQPENYIFRNSAHDSIQAPMIV